jgi:tetraacyldisaccharide 4'-kinase
LLAHEHTTAREIGDEPMQFHIKFPKVAVAVGEDRTAAMVKLLHDRPETAVVILDDSFQHRKIKPGFNILLTGYDNLFTRDFFLPTGNLRDQKSSSKRADVIVVTKCPNDLSNEQRRKIKTELHLLPHQKAFFTAIEYGEPYQMITKEERLLTLEDEVLLLTGIANPDPLKKYLSGKIKRYQELSFNDHHNYTDNDLKRVTEKLEDSKATRKFILTTEKDAARLIEFKEAAASLPLYVLPVRHRFLFGGGMQFDEIVNNFIETFQARKKYE